MLYVAVNYSNSLDSRSKAASYHDGMQMQKKPSLPKKPIIPRITHPNVYNQHNTTIQSTPTYNRIYIDK